MIRSCDICKRPMSRTSFEIEGKKYYLFARTGYLSEERNGRNPRMRYNKADICKKCLKAIMSGKKGKIL